VATDARPIPVLPEVGSMMTLSGVSSPFCYGVVNHGEGDPVLDRPCRIEKLHLAPKLGVEIVRTLRADEFHQRRFADEFRDLRIDFHVDTLLHAIHPYNL